MQLPPEIWINIYIFTNNDDKIVKILRSLCKTTLKVGYDYFKILLNTKILLHYNNQSWNIGNEPIPYISRFYVKPTPLKPTSFQMTVKDLYQSCEKSKIKYSYFGETWVDDGMF
jgi:hypothetical protein